MLGIRLWIKISKISGMHSGPQQELYKASLNLFESVQYKILKIKKSFSENFPLSDSELEAYSRYISVLSMQLVQNWEEIVKISMEVISCELEKFLSEDFKEMIKVARILRFCKLIEKECMGKEKIKIEYDRPEIVKVFERVRDLKGSVLKKYLRII